MLLTAGNDMLGMPRCGAPSQRVVRNRRGRRDLAGEPLTNQHVPNPVRNRANFPGIPPWQATTPDLHSLSHGNPLFPSRIMYQRIAAICSPETRLWCGFFSVPLPSPQKEGAAYTQSCAHWLLLRCCRDPRRLSSNLTLELLIGKR